MCGSSMLSGTQGAYNEDRHPEDAKPYEESTENSSTESASVNESGLPNGENMKDELTRSSRANNATIGKRGFGA